MTETRRFALIGLGAVILSAAAPAYGDNPQRRRRRGDTDYERSGVERDARRRYAPLAPLRGILDSVRRSFGGEVVGVQFLDAYNVPIYRVTLISEENLYLTVYIDARTGRMWAVEGR